MKEVVHYRKWICQKWCNNEVGHNLGDLTDNEEEVTCKACKSVIAKLNGEQESK